MEWRVSDLELLRRHEPIVRYTRGEEFFPADVGPYVRASALRVRHPDGRDERLVARGELTLEGLAEPRTAEFGAVHYLKFIGTEDIRAATRALIAQGRRRLTRQKEFRPDRARLARVGYGSRLLDALFSLTLLLRGRVPGDTAVAASIKSREIGGEGGPGVYYGRVIRESGWIALQYWFFYVFNDWRSGYHGVNDHEADWEMVMVYLSEEEPEPQPRWAAYASHDFLGDDLRRRWDDPVDLEVVDGHPVVYAGAGSHASYFRPGEYLTEIEVAFMTPVVRLVNLVRAFWVRTLRQAGEPTTGLNLFRIPFVDYARGDGVSIGPGQERVWEAVLLDPVPAWVSQYRGLWGLHASDPLAGENAPSGPMYNRDGSVRHAWYDPLGWSGLDKVVPPPAELTILEQRRRDLLVRQEELEQQIEANDVDLKELGAEMAALKGEPHLGSAYTATEQRLSALLAETRRLRKERSEGQAALEALTRRAARVAAGVQDDPREHIRHCMEPASDTQLRLGRWMEVWAAISIGVLLIWVVTLMVWQRRYLVPGLELMLVVFVLIEAVFRRQVVRLVTSVTVGLAVVSALVLLYQFFWQLTVAGLVLAGLFLTWENVQELRG